MNNDRLEVERTEDGSSTLYRKDIDEHYHSVKGAMAESRHVYLDMGWRLAAARRASVRVFEVGFGTGLNAALTAEAALREKVHTKYFSVELYPLAFELAMELDYDKSMNFYEAVNRAEWNTAVEINDYFTLVKISADFLAMELPEEIDVVYFDAFAPEKQSDMWGADVFARIYGAMAPDGILTTYCAKGIIRRRLQDTGFTVQRLAGPENGKREILRALKIKSRL
ncbi:MAG: tRNA (5-methylaminomethyl-2-thiouridine)(34)-methyltransferase MnmD [Muribaculaceae bacterium]|nr:tRNA (5-methylaminomethyl-2-thiouridine)(34)-methyltransferase MnmD [Muribaculaceae bacterium]MDE6130827.1 tRNA (5-methylaminomethyl-2-thiouridine)(34)-methyltransferase MnmD [Muribaculaceae bacterium]